MWFQLPNEYHKLQFKMGCSGCSALWSVRSSTIAPVERRQEACQFFGKLGQLELCCLEGFKIVQMNWKGASVGISVNGVYFGFEVCIRFIRSCHIMPLPLRISAPLPVAPLLHPFRRHQPLPSAVDPDQRWSKHIKGTCHDQKVHLNNSENEDVQRSKMAF